MISATFQIVKVANLAAIPTNFPGHICHYTENTSKYYIWRNNLLEEIFFLAPGLYEPAIAPGTIYQYWRGDKTWQILDKSAVGLTNVDNTSDINKPISTATQTALNGKADLDPATGKLTSSQIPSISLSEFCGALANVTAMTAPGLLTNNGNVPNIGDWCTRTDEQYSYILATFPHTVAANWVKVIAPFSPVLSVNGQVGDVVLTKTDIGLGNVPNVDATNPANIIQTTNYRFVTDLQINTWNAKQEALVSGVNIKTVNGETILGAGNISTYSNTGNILYVAITGSDADPARASHLGSINKPFLTIEAAANAAIAGDLIYVYHGTYTPISNIAKDGVDYYFEPGCVVTKTTVGNLFDTTGFVGRFNIYGQGEFLKTTNTGYILYLNNTTYDANGMVFECKRIYSNQTHIIWVQTGGCICNWKIDYALATVGMVMYLNYAGAGGAFKIDFHTWKSTGSNVISGYWWYYTDMNLNGLYFISTANTAINKSLNSCNLLLNIDYISGTGYKDAIGSATAIDIYQYTASLTVNCSYCSGLFVDAYDCTTTLSGSFYAVQFASNYSTCTGGTIQFLTVNNGHVKTTVGRIGTNITNSPSYNITNGLVDITIGSSNYGMRGNISGGVVNIFGNQGQGQQYIDGVYISGGQVNVMADMIINGGINFWESNLFILSGGILKIKSRIKAVLNGSTPDGAIVKWSGGTLILDNATLTTIVANYYAIRATTAGLAAKIYSGGFNYNKIDYGGPQTGNYFERSYTINSVAFTQVYLGVYISESDTATYNTTAKIAARMVALINANSSVNTVVFAYQDVPNTDTFFRIRSVTKGPAFTYGNGSNTSDALVKYGSYPFTYIGNGLVNINENIE